LVAVHCGDDAKVNITSVFQHFEKLNDFWICFNMLLHKQGCIIKF